MKVVIDNNDFVIALGDKRDGVFGNKINTRDQNQINARQSFLSKIAINQLTIIDTSGKKILINPSGERVHATSVIFNKKSAFGIFTADCPILIAYNPTKKTAGIVHLGWWQVYKNVLKAFTGDWEKITGGKANINSAKIFITSGICKNCFTFSGPKGFLRIILFKFSKLNNFLLKNNGVYSFDLINAIKYRLNKLGFSDNQIEIDKECTFESDNLSSHRREGKNRPSSNFVVVNLKK